MYNREVVNLEDVKRNLAIRCCNTLNANRNSFNLIVTKIFFLECLVFIIIFCMPQSMFCLGLIIVEFLPKFLCGA